MATWQYDLILIPRSKLRVLFPDVTDRVDPDAFDPDVCWAEHQPPGNYDELIASFVPEYQSWSDTFREWGVEDGDQICVVLEDERVVEISARLDARELNMKFIAGLASLAEYCDCLLLTEEMKVIEPEIDNILSELRQSNAVKFVENPGAFLDSLSGSEEQFE